MAGAETNTIEVHARAEDFGTAKEFVAKVLSGARISEETVGDIEIIFDALFNSILAQGFGSETILEITEQKKFGAVYVVVEFEGDRFSPQHGDDDADSPEENLLEAFGDKIDYGYQLGCNSITITVKRKTGIWALTNVGSMLLAIVVYAVLANVLDQQAQNVIANDYLYYVGTLFSNAALMISAPVTLFSLLKNAAEAFITERRYSNVRNLRSRVFANSVVSILLAMVMGWILCNYIDVSVLVPGENAAAGLSLTFKDIINDIIPSSIVEPLETIAPLPLIVLSMMCTYALCSVGEHFDMLKRAIDACYALFSRILSLVLGVLPIFSFLAVLYTLLANGPVVLLSVFLVAIVILLSLCLLFVYYTIWLKVSGVKLTTFFKGLPALIFENNQINGAIDAVPFNVRYCSKVYGINQQRLARDLPVLAQVNRDGNCYLLMMVALMAVLPRGIDKVSILEISVLALLVLFLSLGSPNQPGSILIGTVIIANYLNMTEIWVLGVFLEVFLGRAQNLTNVLGNIAMTAIDDVEARHSKG